MTRLQLYVRRCSGGAVSLLTVNASPNIESRLHDGSDALQPVVFDTSVSHSFYYVSYTDDAVMLSLIRTTPGSARDHVAATVVIPSDAIIEPQVLLDILDRTMGAITPAGLADGARDVLTKLFDTRFESDRSAAPLIESAGRGVAVCLFGDEGRTMGDFAAAAFYVPEFCDYAGVLLAPRGTALEHGAVAVEPQSVQPTVTISPPGVSAEGFVPHIYRHSFTAPVRVRPGETIDISWRRPGFEPVAQSITVTGAGFVVPMCDTSYALRQITPASFLITSAAEGTPVEGASVKVDGTVVDRPVAIEAARLTNARVEIEAPGYQPFDGTLDLASAAQARVQLEAEGEAFLVYRFELPVKPGSPLEPVKLHVRTLQPLHDSPFEGYDIAGGRIREGLAHINRLRYRPRRPQALLWVVIALAIALILLILFKL